MANCKLGDLAVIIHAPDAPENLGAIVEVVQAVPGCPCGCTTGPCWMVTSKGRKLIGFNIFNMRMSADRVGILDSSLRPIRPQPDDAVDEIVKSAGVAPVTLTEIIAGEEVARG